eukprot:TRINITY_DN369_c0_g1_i1.p1 TRINITY_DN369_c0_g1~~TRINITY_DN369_c0_g1_i1.p1  ORF type:complete len:1711 (+),score=562.95 TRINITY_DN369_c0_g1_i1:90-5222(+)
MAAPPAASEGGDADTAYLLSNKIPLVIEQILADLLRDKPGSAQLFDSVKRSLLTAQCAMDAKQEHDFFALVDQVDKMNTPEGPAVTPEQFLKLGLHFAIPSTREPFELVPGGANVLVTLHRKDEFVRLARAKRAAAQQHREDRSQHAVPTPPRESPRDRRGSNPRRQRDGASAGSGGGREPLTPLGVAVPAKEDEDKTAALFSPTHFQHDLFAPHATTAEVKMKEVQSHKKARPSVPNALNTGGGQATYQPATNPALAPGAHTAGELQNEFLPMVEAMGRFNTPEGERVTPAEWAAMEITWCVPTATGQLVDLIDKGRDTPVAFADKDRYVELAKAKLLSFGQKAGRKAPGLRKIEVATKQDEEKEHALFSPTHFAHDLFAPHTTTQQLGAPRQSVDGSGSGAQPRASLPQAVAGAGQQVEYQPVPRHRDGSAEPASPLSPNTLAHEFGPMLQELDSLNKEGGQRISEQEWNDMDIAWCVPIDGELHDLIPGGRDVKVRLSEKDRFCQLALEKMQSIGGRAGSVAPAEGRKRRQKSLAPIAAPKQDEEKEHKLFSPTHFAHDLFAPHQTTAAVEQKIQQTGVALTHAPEAISKGASVQAPKQDEAREHAMFSPTHFAVDLFAPHTTSDQVGRAGQEPRASLPDAIAGQGKHVVYHPAVQQVPGADATLSPLSPRALASDFGPMLDQLRQVATTGELPEAEWDEMLITWCIPHDGTIHDLVPGGSDLFVRLPEAARYCQMPRAKLDELTGAPTSGRRRTKKRLSLRLQESAQQREQKEHALFSPTHFANDLFAPHTTTQEVNNVSAMNQASTGQQRRPSLPAAMPGGGQEYNPHMQKLPDSPDLDPSAADKGPLSPASLAKDFLPMIEQLDKLNRPGEQQLSEAEWKELGVTWCVPVAGQLYDLVPNGRDISVPLSEKARYCALARTKLEEVGSTSRKGKMPRNMTISTIDAVPSKAQKKEERDAALFSPSHFAQDLFAPHTTTQAMAQKDQTTAPVPQVAAGMSEPDDLLSPRSHAKRFWPMIDAVAAFNTGEGRRVSAEEFADMGIRFCVPNPLDYSEVLELFPGGKNIQVTLDRKDEFVQLARMLYHEKIAEQRSGADDGHLVAPLSPTSLNAQFMPMIQEIEQMNTPQGNQMTPEEFAELDITWCVPCDNEIIDLKPNGRNIKVKLAQKNEYVNMARMRLEFEAKRRQQQGFSQAQSQQPQPPPQQQQQAPAKKGLTKNYSLDPQSMANIAAKNEERDHAMFSPTHFAHDLFAPHTTSKAVERNSVVGSHQSAPQGSGLQGSASQEGLTQQDLDTEFYPMVEDLAKANQPGGIPYTADEWRELGLTYCIPLAGAVYDFIPNGRHVPVPLSDKDGWIRMVREYRRNQQQGPPTPSPQADAAPRGPGQGAGPVSSKLKLAPLNESEVQKQLDQTNAMFSPTHFQHDLFAPAAAAVPQVHGRQSLPVATTQSGNRARGESQTRSSLPQKLQGSGKPSPGPLPPSQPQSYQAPPVRPGTVWDDQELDGHGAAQALGRLLQLPQQQFEALKVTWTLPHGGVVHELVVGGRTMIVSYEQRFRFADLVTQAKRALDAGSTWLPAPPPHSQIPHLSQRTHPGPCSQPSTSTGHFSPHKAGGTSSSNVSECASYQGVQSSSWQGAEPTLVEFLDHCRLPFLLGTLADEGVENMSDLCELLDEDFAFITKVMHRRRLLNALQPHRLAHKAKQQQLGR